MRLDEHASAIALPLTYWLMGRPYAAMLRELRDNETLAPEQLEQLQFAKLTALLEHCYTNVPYYRSMFERIGAHPSDIRTMAEYAMLPTLDKETVQREAESLGATNFADKPAITVSTGGSTGTPVKLRQDQTYYDWGWAVFLRNMLWTGFQPGERQAWFTRPATPDLKRQIHLALERRWVVGVVLQSEAAIAQWARGMQKHRPRFIYGYPSVISALATYVLDHGIELDSVRQVMTSSETLFANQREEIGRAFGAPVFNQYGSTETYGISSECTSGSMHVNSDLTVVEYQPVSGPGGTVAHEVIVTPLMGYGMPLLRYRSGDQASPAEGRCPCGLPLPLMQMPEGRVDDTVTFSDGTVISAMLLERLVRGIPGIARFQFRQTAPDALELLVIKDQRFTEKTRETLADTQRRFASESGVRVQITPLFVDAIAPTRSGKHKSVVALKDETPR